MTRIKLAGGDEFVALPSLQVRREILRRGFELGGSDEDEGEQRGRERTE
jgi:hypothetical protein